MKEKINLYYQKYKNKKLYGVCIDDNRHATESFDFYGNYYDLLKEYPKKKYHYIKVTDEH